MAQQLTEILNYFLENYIQGKNEKNGKNAAAWKVIRDGAPEKVYETGLVDKEKYLVKGSVGKGVWADVPWLGIFRKEITTSAQRGVYIVYLLASDASAIYLTFNQGVTDPIKNVNPYVMDSKDSLKKSSGEIIRENVKIVRKEIGKRGFLSDDGIHLADGGLGKEYEKGTFFYKKYAKGALPTEEKLQKDLKEMLEIYEEFYGKFYNPTGKTSHNKPPKEEKNMNLIFFGAPGTGKSYKVNDIIQDKQTFRTTFHPDYDYAQFVGAYKPKKEGEKITYTFVPQVFAKAYAAAWKLQLTDAANANVFLVIEEINRGNCAQIFGDIFQLLDRDGDGFSQYSIDADCDFAEWLETDEKGLKFVWDKYKETVGEGKLKLPPNLNILATMNTSDQSLFPMDSAFKRRFDWEYVPISFDGKDAANFQIDIDGFQYSWQKFVETVNEKILSLTESEDKQLGEFFIKPESGNVISKDRFLGKVMFYLWNEVCKDEHKNGSFFRTKDGDKEKYFTFQDLYRDKGLLKRFIEKLFEEGPSQE